MEYILTFENTNFAIKAEQSLLAEKLQVGVMPLPSQIRAGCGICLRIKEDEIKAALSILKNINEIGLFSRIKENGKIFYEEVKRLWPTRAMG